MILNWLFIEKWFNYKQAFQLLFSRIMCLPLHSTFLATFWGGWIGACMFSESSYLTCNYIFFLKIPVVGNRKLSLLFCFLIGILVLYSTSELWAWLNHPSFLPQNRLNITKTVRKYSIDSNLRHTGSEFESGSIANAIKHDEDVDEEYTEGSVSLIGRNFDKVAHQWVNLI